MPKRRHTVVLESDVSGEIQSAFIKTAGSAHGAMQKGLARGADLVLAEIRGESPPVPAQHPTGGTTEAGAGPIAGDPINTVVSLAEKLSEAVLELKTVTKELRAHGATPKKRSGGNKRRRTPEETDRIIDAHKAAIRKRSEPGERSVG